MTEASRDSITTYAAYVDGTRQAIIDTFQSTEGIDAAAQAISAARRIFFSGSGSSIPAALAGQQLLTKYSDKAGIFAPSSLLLDDPQLSKDDVVVLVSQGWSRADAALITRKVVASEAKLIVITGRPDRLESYTSDPDRIITVPVYPAREKIFCRPGSVITGYIQVVRILAALTGVDYSQEEWLRAYDAGTQQAASDISADKHYVVLASNLLLCAGNNLTLSLREGAGRYGWLQEIESYGHGVYVPDQTHRNETHYIILNGNEDSHSSRAVGRIMPLLRDTASSYEVWEVASDEVLGNVTLMARTAQTVLASIRADHWDMNNPPGMEENRGFHEVTA